VSAAALWCVIALNVNVFRADAHAAVVMALLPRGSEALPRAEAAAREAVRLAPWEPAYQVELAVICAAQAAAGVPAGRAALTETARRGLAEAEQHLHRAIAREPRDFQLHLALGKLCGYRARWEPAYVAKGEQAFRDAAATTPRRQQVYWAWGDFYRGLGRPDAAVERYRYAVSLDERVAVAHRMLAELHVKLGQAPPAEREYAAAWALERRNIDPRDAAHAQLAPRQAAEGEKLAELLLAAGEQSRAARHRRARMLRSGTAAAPRSHKREEG
jgi:hypothetical protein